MRDSWFLMSMWVVVLLLGSVAGGGDAAALSQATATEPGPAAGQVTSADDVDRATVRIESIGSFLDPEIGQQQLFAGSGSGFIIDPSGIAVTNNHVVTGGALFDVYVTGETEPRNAHVLGVSECSDLAVIDIDGEGFPYLGWYDNEIDERLEVFAAGFPLGEPEFTITAGIVNAAQKDIQTAWASAENVIEHSARIRPGSSGGPLVTGDGLVVGVNYAGDDQTDRNFAISAAEVQPLVERLREGEDVTSIGVNGSAVSFEDLTGVWVASVEPGSPAQEAGVQSGDLITRLERLPLAHDGTLAIYCDVLRSHDPQDVLALEVLRLDTGEVLTGEINGEQLDQPSSAEPGPSGPQASGPYEFMTVMDDTEAITVDVPMEWSDIDGAPFTDEQGRRFADLRASSDLDDFFNGWDTPGVIVSVTSQVDSEVELLDELVDPLSEACTYGGREPYSDQRYAGQFDSYRNCGATDARYIVIGLQPETGGFAVRIEVLINSDRDIEALEQILDTLEVSDPGRGGQRRRQSV